MPRDSLPPQGGTLHEHRVLVLPTTRADAAAIARVFAANGIESLICRDVDHLCAEAREGAGAVLISEEPVLDDADELARCIAAQPVWSDLPVILLSRSGRESTSLTHIVARLGNASVVERPIRTTTLITLVRSSLRARERQYEVREYLIQQEQVQAERQRVAMEREQLLESERAARAEAERASRIKDEFLATLSHELRTPLNAVLGWTQVLHRTPDLPPEAAKALTVIERNARSQAQIIADLLDMSSVMSGKVRLELRPLDPASVIKLTLDSVRPTAQAKGVHLGVSLDPDAGLVRGDANRLQQVLWNLLSNALKFTPKDGHVDVRLARAGASVEVEVSDSGEGIDPTFVPHMFDRFRQANASTTRQHGGLGIGLSIVKHLVEMHGGTICVHSAGAGKGATFRVTLPAMTSDADTAEHEVRRATPVPEQELDVLVEAADVDLGGVTVLVVDDEPDARALLQRLLHERNAHVLTASSAQEAMQIVACNPPHIIVSDIGMPGEDGYSLIRRVRALPDDAAAIPAIALTAYARAEDRAKAMQAGFQHHVAKPVEPAEIVAMVDSLARAESGERRAP